MTSAPVGFQCPACIHEARATVRQPTTVLGGRPIRRPYLTFTLIGVNVVVFVLELVAGINAMAGDWGMWPIAVAGGEWWRLLTAAFLHGGWLHILFNMYVLFSIGQTLERILGHVRYGLLYVLAALGGSIASYAFSAPNVLSVGASGAIFGLMGALVVAGRRLRYDIRQVLILLAINTVIGFLASGVDWRAHLGGLVTGAAVAAVYVWAPRASRVLWQTLGVLGVLGVLVAVALWRTASIASVLTGGGV
jgi:membrane associated rhomboid family serine protease